MATDAPGSTGAALLTMSSPAMDSEAIDLQALADVRDNHEANNSSLAYRLLTPFLEGDHEGTICCLAPYTAMASWPRKIAAHFADKLKYNQVSARWNADVHNNTPAISSLNATSGHKGCVHCLTSGGGITPGGCVSGVEWVSVVRDNPDFVPFLVWAFACPYHSNPTEVSVTDVLVDLFSTGETQAPLNRPKPSVVPLFLHKGVLDSAAIQIARLRSSMDKTILPDIMGVVGKLLECVRNLHPTARARMVEIHARSAILMVTAPQLIVMLHRTTPVGKVEAGGSDKPPTGASSGAPDAGDKKKPPGDNEKPAAPDPNDHDVKFLEGHFMLTHEHEGIALGFSAQHYHQCAECKKPFTHKHVKKDPAYSALHYTHNCGKCAAVIKKRDVNKPPMSGPGEGDGAPPTDIQGVTHAKPVDESSLAIPPPATPPDEMPLRLGYISPDKPFPTRDDVVVTRKIKVPGKKTDVKHVRKNESLEAVWRLYESGQASAAVEALSERTSALGASIRPAFHFIGHHTPGLKYYVSSGHKLNFLQAAGGRHFKPKEPKDPEAMRDLTRVSGIVCKHIVKLMVTHGTIEEAAAFMECMPEMFKSKKWPPRRFGKEILGAALKYSCVTASAKTGLPKPRSITVKLTEALAKEKARLIMASGDEGAIVHLFDAAIIEYALFHLQEFEDRSIKHTGLDGKCARMRKISTRFTRNASMDFGAYDGSIDSEVRAAVENKLVTELAELYLKNSPLKDAAVTDRLKEEFEGYFEDYLIRTRNMIRESGDRGTSVFNFYTNFVLFAYGLWREQLHQLTRPITGTNGAGQPCTTAMNRGDAKNQADKYLAKWLDNPETREADLIGEGDDGSQGFTDEYITRADAATGWNTASDGDVTFAAVMGEPPNGADPVFGERWLHYYKQVGFSLEPQGPNGEVPAALAIRLSSERVEFISTIWVTFDAMGDTLRRTYCFPKPVKSVTGSIISFALSVAPEVAAYTKMVSLMDNCIHCPLLFEYYAMQARYWESEGGKYDDNALDLFKRDQLADRRFESLRATHEKFLLEEGASNAVRRAIEREIGIPPDSQVLHEAAFKAADQSAVAGLSRSLYYLLGMIVIDQ